MRRVPINRNTTSTAGWLGGTATALSDRFAAWSTTVVRRMVLSVLAAASLAAAQLGAIPASATGTGGVQTSLVRPCGVATFDAISHLTRFVGFTRAECADGWALANGSRAFGGASRLFARRHGRWVMFASGAGYDDGFTAVYLEFAPLESNINPALLRLLAQPFDERVRQAANAGALLEQLAAHEAHIGAADLYNASAIVASEGRAWFVVAGSDSSWSIPITPASHPYPDSTAWVYLWSSDRWTEQGVVRGWLGPVGECCGIFHVSLTGSRDPDFAVIGGGAADTTWLSIISHAGGHWHAVPFHAGYGYADVVNGSPVGNDIETMVNDCGCASGPTSTLFERYSHGAFQPRPPPGRSPPCTIAAFDAATRSRSRPNEQFSRADCEDGWALAVGRSGRTEDRVVGLFEDYLFGGTRNTWHLMELDNGESLATLPALYDIPLSTLARLASGFGRGIRPYLALAPVIAVPVLSGQLDENKVEPFHHELWFVHEIATRYNRLDVSPIAESATIYRWSGSRWVRRGFVGNLPNALFGVQFRAVASNGMRVPAFADSNTGSGPSLSDAGGSWHVQA